MHFFNLFIFSRMRARARVPTYGSQLPLPPQPPEWSSSSAPLT
jgi:hypothetical protein